MENTIIQQANNIFAKLQHHRRWLHSHAEVGFQLSETYAYVEQELMRLGYAPEKCGKCGIIAIAGGKKPGKTFLLRADMDALPIQEETELDFACKDGNMHACGHDFHTAMLLGAAEILKSKEDEINGTVKLMFQPAEEIFGGAADMIDHGVLTNPQVDAAMMIHVAAGIPIPAGTAMMGPAGVSAPAADYFSISIRGKGCHGSAPHLGIDPLIPAAHMLLALENLQARELAAGNRCVLTVGKINGGNAGNAIADFVTMEGTLRTYDEETRSYVKERLQQLSNDTAKAFRGEGTVTFGSGCPTLTNDKDLTDFVEGSLSRLLGKNNVLNPDKMGGSIQGGGSEDFAYISRAVPSLMLGLAAGEPSKGFPYPQHHPKVDFDEKVLPTGAAIMADTAMQWLAVQ